MKKFVLMIAAAAVFSVLLWGCSATSSSAKKTSPGQSSAAEPVIEVQNKDDFENRPLEVLPPDPPLPKGAEEVADDSWAKDEKREKLKEKDKNLIKGSQVNDDSWGKD